VYEDEVAVVMEKSRKAAFAEPQGLKPAIEERVQSQR
jgi:hypothetical protein